jgi:geranylgeranyl diphosphate synthase type I
MTHSFRIVTTQEGPLDIEQALQLVESKMREAVLAHGGGGILQRACLTHLESGGKRTRAWLMLGALEALGHPLEDGLDFAAAVELLHNASLIHDDLEDGDRVRRGKPTIGASFGDAQALNAGDFLLLLPGLLIARSPLTGSVRLDLSEQLALSALSTAAGQSHDLALLEAGDTSFESYAKAAGGKTAPFFSLPVIGAALIAGWNKEAALHLAEPFVKMGLLYQMCDDHADLYGEKGREDAGNDIAEGKISLLVVEHLKRRPQEREALLQVLRRDRVHTTREAIGEVKEWFVRSGAQAAAQKRILDESRSIAGHAVLNKNPNIRVLVDALMAMILAGSAIQMKSTNHPEAYRNVS